MIVTADEAPDPYRLELSCSVVRGGVERFSATISTSGMRRRIEELVGYLLRANPVPAGSVLLTGSGIVASESAAIQPGDKVSICSAEIGELSNTAAVAQ